MFIVGFLIFIFIIVFIIWLRVKVFTLKSRIVADSNATAESEILDKKIELLKLELLELEMQKKKDNN